MLGGQQLEFGFSPAVLPVHQGLSRWQEERREATDQLSRRIGLSLGHLVHVTLNDGTELDGILNLAEDSLWVAEEVPATALLRIHRCTFAVSEIQSCTRSD